MSDEDKKLEAAAEAWVNLLFAQIEAKKQQKIKKSATKTSKDSHGRALQL